MNLQEFYEKYKGKFIDFDGSFGNQCVDLIRRYCEELGLPQLPRIVGAGDWWDRTDIPTVYTKVTNTPEALPKAGDILVWKKTTSLPYGHTGIFLEGNLTNFVSFDQNYPTGRPCERVGHTFKNIAGWFHPKENMSQVTLDSAKFEELVTKATAWDQVRALGYLSAAGIEQEIRDLKGAIDEKNNTIEALEVSRDEARKTLNELIAICAKALGTVQEIEQIKGALTKLTEDLDNYDDLKHNYAELQLHTKEQDQIQEREIARLKALLEQILNLSGMSAEELLLLQNKLIKEYIRRALRLLNMAK